MPTYNKAVTFTRPWQQSPNWSGNIKTELTALDNGSIRVKGTVTITNPSSSASWDYSGNSSYTPGIRLVWIYQNASGGGNTTFTLGTWTKAKLNGGENISFSYQSDIAYSGATMTGYLQAQVTDHTDSRFPWFFHTKNYDGTVTTTSRKFTLTINPQGGNYHSSTDNTTYHITYGTGDWANMASIAGAASKTGYTFKGIYTATSGGTQIYTSGGVAVPGTTYWDSNSHWKYAGNVTLYAQWTPITYTISYSLGGGSFPNGYNTTYDTASYTYLRNPTSVAYDNSAYTVTSGKSRNTFFEVEKPIRTGYTFKGWTVTGMDSSTHNYWIDSNHSSTATTWDTSTWSDISPKVRRLRATAGTVTYTAQWEIITGRLYYNAGTAYDTHVGTAKNNDYCDGLVAVSDHNNFAALDGTARYSTYNITSTDFNAWNTTTFFNPPAGYDHAPEATQWKIWNYTKAKWISTTGVSAASIDFTDFSSSDLTWGDTLFFFANWQPKTYTVNYYHAGSKAGSSTFTFGTAGTLKTTTTLGISESGWSFRGWADANNDRYYNYGNGASFNPSTYNATINLYSVWYRTAYWKSGINSATSVSCTGDQGQRKYYDGTTAKYWLKNQGEPTAISGWTTLGWLGSTTAWKQSTASTADYWGTAQTVYAVYNTTATFYSGYNKASSSTATAYYNSSNTSSVSAPAPTAISGWTARGWRADTTVSDRSYAVTTATTMTGFGTNKTFYHVYSRTGTVTYNANGGSGTTSASTSEAQYLSSASTSLNPASLSVTLRANGFTYPGYTFTKWDLGNANASYSWTPAYNASTAKTAKAQWSMNQQIHIKINNAWHTGAVWVKVNGTWEKASAVWIKVNGTWKQITKL